MVHGTVHTKAYNHLLGTQRGGSIRVPTARTDFHVYAIEWTPEEIRWFVDDSLYYRFPNERLTNPDADWRHWPFDQPFHLIMNIAVGGTWGGQQGVDPEASRPSSWSTTCACTDGWNRSSWFECVAIRASAPSRPDLGNGHLLAY